MRVAKDRFVDHDRNDVIDEKDTVIIGRKLTEEGGTWSVSEYLLSGDTSEVETRVARVQSLSGGLALSEEVRRLVSRIQGRTL